MLIRALHRTWMILALGMLAACGNSDSPEQQVRTVIDQMERAAENRDVGELTEHLSEDFGDSNGNGREEIARYLRGYFIANQSIQLLTRIEQLEFPADDEARAQVLVGMVSRDAAATNQWDLAADLQAFDIALRREDGAWKVIFARVIQK
ncbi:MAG TPA: hypothetical protein VGE08_14445 [Steroidobacter sp.]|uniref:Rv0361 family membrane protein n=1 Tax=Steroidobacter sp. TaxID=1978227 RepID=UPI002EDAC54C